MLSELIDNMAKAGKAIESILDRLPGKQQTESLIEVAVVIHQRVLTGLLRGSKAYPFILCILQDLD